MGLSAPDAVALARDELIPKWRAEKAKLDRIDRWARWSHDDPHRPRQATPEYRELAARAQAPWGDLIVGSIAQTLYVEGYRRPDAPEDGRAWRIWQANHQDGRQVALHRAALTFGLAYSTVLPGRTITGDSMPVFDNVSPRDMLAVFDDPASDEWPLFAVKVRKARAGFKVDLLDDERVTTFVLAELDDAKLAEPATQLVHNAGVCPVVRFTNRMDLEGRVAGEIEPFIPLLGKIDQTSFDRLVVQRFASWVVRTIAGMSVDESAEATGKTPGEVIQELKVNDILVAKDPEARFGSLPATPLDGFIAAREADLSDLSAVSQTPAFELLGRMANLSAEALAAAKASQTAKSDERKHTLGEQHEQRLRLGCWLAGDVEGASDFSAQVRWADTSIRSLAQAADALGKLRQMLGIPTEVLIPKVPGFTDQDVDEALDIMRSGGGLGDLLAELTASLESPAPAEA